MKFGEQKLRIKESGERIFKFGGKRKAKFGDRMRVRDKFLNEREKVPFGSCRSILRWINKLGPINQVHD
jgi:hypothetical protein